MSRASRRNRGRGQALAVKARMPAARVAFTAEQVDALLGATRAGTMTAEPLPRPPEWATGAFPPGRPLYPAAVNPPRRDTGQAEPRLSEFDVAWNIRTYGRVYVPWKTLSDASTIPLVRKCIEARKTICALGFAVTVDPVAVARAAAASGEAEKDIEARLRKDNEADIARVSDWLEYPDRGNGLDWENWARLLFENSLVYDAAVIYPRKTLGGDTYSWEISDGKLWKPLIDDYGRRPAPPFPAWQQILYGYPRGEYTADTDPDDTDPATGKPRIPGGFTSDTVMYERRLIRPASPNGYGMPPVEIALLDALVWMRRMGWISAEYTDGMTPRGYFEAADTIAWSVQQWEDWSVALNEKLSGQTRERQRSQMLPPGIRAVFPPDAAEKYKPDYDMLLIKLIAGAFGLTATEMGFPEVGSLGASFHEGEEDVLNRKTRIPDANWLARIATRLARRQLGMARELKVTILGLESEDEAAADAVALARIARGVMTRNEDRGRLGLPPLEFPEADMITVESRQGLVFLEGASEVAPPGTTIVPASLKLQPGQVNDASETGAGTGNGKAPAKPAAKAARDTAAQVYEQLAEDYPPAAMGWIHHAAWQGPVSVPLDHVDMSGRKTWAANRETSKVAHFKAKIQAKGRTKPVVMVKTPGSAKLKIVDGHHRTLAYSELGLPVRAYIGTVGSDKGPWDEMHDRQFTTEQEEAAGRAPSDTAASTAADKSAAEERRNFSNWKRRPYREPGDVFVAKVLTAELAPDLAGDGRILLKDASPKACAGSGPAGSGTWTS